MERRSLEEAADQVADLILGSLRVVVFTGAGVSTESGLPDFRGPDGIWTKYNPDDFTYQKYLADPEARKRMWQMMIQINSWAEAKSNPAHLAIAELEKLGKLDSVITQNVDGLHQQAGNSPEKVFELHGNIKRGKCISCGKRYDMSDILGRVTSGIEDPHCDECHGILKSDGVAFGEPLPEKEMREATYRSRNCDLFIVIGSTLVVYPAAYMPSYALEAGAKLVIINLSPTPLDTRATVLIREKAGVAMSLILERVKNKME